MSVILAIDTSIQACSCALNRDGEISETFAVVPRQHAGKLLPMISDLLKSHGLSYENLDAVAYGQGPGSFTGLRIAAGVTQGIAFGAGLPVIPVSTLASQAMQLRNAIDPGLVFSTLDARIDEVYYAFFRLDPQGIEAVGEAGLCKPEALPVPVPGTAECFAAVGSGLAYQERMPATYRDCFVYTDSEVHPRAGVMAELAAGMLAAGQTQLPEDVNPVYLRDKVTHG